jgi:arsenite methyltransferase
MTSALPGMRRALGLGPGLRHDWRERLFRRSRWPVYVSDNERLFGSQVDGRRESTMEAAPMFDETMARRLEAIYRSDDAARRRRAVLAALDAQPGERAVDIGTGPGFLAFELAERVGPPGSVLGVDTSEPMLALAAQRCAGQPHVRFAPADARVLPLSDEEVDLAVSVQVFEYVDDVEAALAEMHRVMRPGGRAVIVSTDWNTLAWNSSDGERMGRVMSVFAAHCPHQDLPRTLAPRLVSAGFEVVRRYVLPQFNPVFDESSFSMLASGPIAAFVVGTGRITAQEAEAWAADLRRTGERGDYFFCLNQYLFGVTRL